MKTLAIVIWFGLACTAGFALFNITFKVQKLEVELTDLNRQILTDQQSIHILRAEWSYLDRPERLKTLVSNYLPDLKTEYIPPSMNIELLPMAETVKKGGPEVALNTNSGVKPGQ